MLNNSDLPLGIATMHLVGSTAIYGSGADIDYIILVGNQVEWAHQAIVSGWQYGKGYSLAAADMISLRKGSYNLIVTDKPWMIGAFLLATDTMKKVSNLVPSSNKAARVELHELFRSWFKEYHDKL